MRLDGNDTFAENERKLSVAMAREGAPKATATYDTAREGDSEGRGGGEESNYS